MSEEKIYLGKQCEEYYKKYNLVSAVHKIIDLEEVLNKIKEYIEHENYKRNILLGISEKKYTRDILNHILEILEEIE